MATIPVRDIIHAEKARSIDQVLLVIQHLKKTNPSKEVTELDFSGVHWTTSMFLDRLVRALDTFFGHSFEEKVKVSGIEHNAMFPSLWQSSLDKVRFSEHEA